LSEEEIHEGQVISEPPLFVGKSAVQKQLQKDLKSVGIKIDGVISCFFILDEVEGLGYVPIDSLIGSLIRYKGD